MSVRIILVDDHKIMREGLRMLLGKEQDFEVIAEADNGRTAVQLCHELSPDVVIMDVTMSDLNGIEATRQITRKAAGVKVIALSMHSDRRFVEEMLQAGAAGYLLKYNAFDDLNRAIRSVVADKIFLSPEITKVVVKDFVYRPQKASAKMFKALTPRECEVLQFLAEGEPTKQIARFLKISVKTVETHRQQIMGKLDMHSIAELTKYAVREGLTSLDV